MAIKAVYENQAYAYAIIYSVGSDFKNSRAVIEYLAESARSAIGYEYRINFIGENPSGKYYNWNYLISRADEPRVGTIKISMEIGQQNGSRYTIFVNKNSNVAIFTSSKEILANLQKLVR